MQHSLELKRQAFLVSLLCVTTVWGYIYSDTKEWSDTDYYCGSCLQSPINILKDKTEHTTVRILILNNYDKPTPASVLVNDGDTVHINVDPALNATVTSLHLHDVYQAEQIYFHWGTKSDLGTEHAVNFVHEALEMQIYHRNVVYPTRELALNGVNGYMALSILYTEVENHSHIPKGMQEICDNLVSIRNRPRLSITSPKGFTLNSLFTALQIHEYYTYCGSHTTPPCIPNVTWIVFPNALKISRQCLNAFRSVVSSSGGNMTKTLRELQPTQSRRIFHNSL